MKTNWNREEPKKGHGLVECANWKGAEEGFMPPTWRERLRWQMRTMWNCRLGNSSEIKEILKYVERITFTSTTLFTVRIDFSPYICICLKAGTVKSENTATARQRPVETRFRFNKWQWIYRCLGSSGHTFSWQRRITRKWTVVFGVLSPVRLKPAQSTNFGDYRIQG
jgi:hypothetical protein